MKYKEKKQYFLLDHKYGITAHPNEAFGISVAEIVKAGCIVWVPDRGGQREIVDHTDLVVRDVDDAVDKIKKVLKIREKQEDLQEHLKRQSMKFSVKRFKKEVRKLIRDYFGKDDS
ncbi:glycosyltransferase [bacterium]|nr:glycosyltransferase [bacterium]